MEYLNKNAIERNEWVYVCVCVRAHMTWCHDQHINKCSFVFTYFITAIAINIITPLESNRNEIEKNLRFFFLFSFFDKNRITPLYLRKLFCSFDFADKNGFDWKPRHLRRECVPRVNDFLQINRTTFMSKIRTFLTLFVRSILIGGHSNSYWTCHLFSHTRDTIFLCEWSAEEIQNDWHWIGCK